MAISSGKNGLTPEDLEDEYLRILLSNGYGTFFSAAPKIGGYADMFSGCKSLDSLPELNVEWKKWE